MNPSKIHYIHFSYDINAKTCGVFQSFCLQAIDQGASEIRVHLTSAGGSTQFGFALYNFIRSLPVPVVMHNIGNVESIAVIVYLAADKRLVCKQARFKLHPLFWTFGGVTNDHSRIREAVACLDNDLERYVQIFKDRTKGADETIDIFKCLSAKELILDPAAATSNGISTSIEDATFIKGAIPWWINSG